MISINQMKKILVVDDEPYFAKTISATLDPRKYLVITAGDGIEGLKMIADQSPDAVLLDINMPNMDGMEMLKKLNSNQKTPKVPVIITSNLTSRDTISEGVALGVRGYIIKSNESSHTIADTIEGLFK